MAAGAAPDTGAKPAKGSDTLTMSKVTAGGMAAATSAIFGSYFGAFGTVGGAALGSVATAVVTHVYQRSIERTQNKVVSTVKHVVGSDSGGGPAAAVASPGDRSATVSPTGRSLDQVRTVRIDQAPTPKRKFPLKLVLASVVVFILGMTLTTGIEAIKGSSVFGNNKGVSVSRIIDPAPATPTETPTQDSDQTSSDNSDGGSNSDSGSDSDRSSSRSDSGNSGLDPLNLNKKSDSDSSSGSSSSSKSSDSSDRSKSSSDRNQGGLVGGLLSGQN